jgi:hypothetical protein
MKKRLSFLPTMLIGLAVLLLIVVGGIWLLENFNLPDWVSPIFIIVGLYSFFEVVGRLGPREFETPIAKFLKLSMRDRIVLIIALLVFLIIAFPIATQFASRWISLLFVGLGFLTSWLICFFFGSKELMQSFSKDQGEAH